MTSYILSKNGVQVVRFDAANDNQALSFALATAPRRDDGDFTSVPQTEGVSLS